MSEKYFIGDVTYTGESNYTARTVSMGDGVTGVNSLVWEDESKVGVLFHRNPAINPFEYVEYSDGNPCPKFQGNLVAITFDNEKSIDAVIRQLNFVKSELNRIKQ